MTNQELETLAKATLIVEKYDSKNWHINFTNISNAMDKFLKDIQISDDDWQIASMSSYDEIFGEIE